MKSGRRAGSTEPRDLPPSPAPPACVSRGRPTLLSLGVLIFKTRKASVAPPPHGTARKPCLDQCLRPGERSVRGGVLILCQGDSSSPLPPPSLVSGTSRLRCHLLYSVFPADHVPKSRKSGGAAGLSPQQCARLLSALGCPRFHTPVSPRTTLPASRDGAVHATVPQHLVRHTAGPTKMNKRMKGPYVSSLRPWSHSETSPLAQLMLPCHSSCNIP